MIPFYRKTAQKQPYGLVEAGRLGRGPCSPFLQTLYLALWVDCLFPNSAFFEIE